jgi:aspartyl/glutamyl-tRNA(Asn/Gln) amidotransferase subunit A (EC 6.3.5.-)
MSFNNKTIEELHDLLVSKEISATELTQATLDDIKAREEAVNAFVTVAEEAALAQAKAIDEKGSMQITSCQGFRSRQRQYLNRWHLDDCGIKNAL